MLQNLPPTGSTNYPLFPWLCWNLWKTKKQKLFSNNIFTVEDTILKTIQVAKEWVQAQPGKMQITSNPVRHMLHGDNQSTRVKTSHSASSENISSPFMAECTAARASITDNVHHGFKHLVLDSDCSHLVQTIKTKTTPSEVHGVISDIFIYLSSFESFFCRFIPRAANYEANSLAKHVLNLYGPTI